MSLLYYILTTPFIAHPFVCPGNDVVASNSKSKHRLKSTGVGTEGTQTARKDQSRSSPEHGKNGNHTLQTCWAVANWRTVDRCKDFSPVGMQNGGYQNTSGDGEELVMAAVHYVPLSPHIANSSTDGATREQARERDPRPPRALNDLSRSSDTSVSTMDSSRSVHSDELHLNNGSNSHLNAQSESQELLLHSSNNSAPSPSPTHPQLHATPHHTSTSFTDTDEASMSTSTIENRGNAESMQLAHLFKVHSLQEELAHLKSKLNDRSIPLDKIMEDLSRVQRDHQQLAVDIEATSTHLDALGKKYNGKLSDRIAKNKTALGNEVSRE